MPLRRIAGATPVQSQGGSTSQPIYADAGDGGNSKVLHTINLDGDELFGQFCAYSSLVILGPRRGVFLSTVPIVTPGQGVMRVWRQWLRDRARDLRKLEFESGNSKDSLERSFTTEYPNVGHDPHIMWTDYRHNVGLRVAVRSRDGKCYDLDGDLDDVPLGFTFEIQGRRLCWPIDHDIILQWELTIIQNWWYEQHTSCSQLKSPRLTDNISQVKRSFSAILLQ